jgi:hypothetical protein
MKIRTLSASAVLAAACLWAGASAAEPVVAKLQAPVPSASKTVAGGAVFECLGDVCAARTPGADTPTLRGCKDLARQDGAVATFGAASKPLSPEEVAACNGSAKK